MKPKALTIAIALLAQVQLLLASDTHVKVKIAPLISFERSAKITRTGKSVSVTALETAPSAIRIRVVDTYKTLGAASASASYSLEEIFNTLHPVVAINAGETASFTLPIPVGLLSSERKITSKLLSAEELPGSGIACFARDGALKIMWAYAYNPFGCENAVQSSPMLIAQQGQEQTFNSDAVAERSVVALDSAENIWFFQTGPISLADLAALLKEDFDIQSALCLGGGTSSGFIAVSHSPTEFRSGNTRSLIASAIVIWKK